MKTLYQGDERVMKILGEQKLPAADTPIRPSFYAVSYTAPGGGIALHNTFTKTTVLAETPEEEHAILAFRTLDADLLVKKEDGSGTERRSLFAGMELADALRHEAPPLWSNPPGADSWQQHAAALAPDTREKIEDALCRTRFLVPEGEDETKLYLDTVQLLRVLDGFSDTDTEINHSITQYVILLTTACNARCFYCYEKGLPAVNMSHQTAMDTVQFIRDTCWDNEIHILWFGGEPLLGAERIDEICTALKAADVPFRSSITTNGLLFDAPMVQRVKEHWNLDWAQIALDGPEEAYNRVKDYVSPGCPSPYRAVLDNIDRLLAACIKVQIRINLREGAGAEADVLLDELKARFCGTNSPSIYTHSLYPEEQQLCYEGVALETAAFDWQLDRLRLKSRLNLTKRTLASARKLRTVLCGPGLFHNRWMVIAPDGRLAGCEHLCEAYYFGDVQRGITDKDRRAALLEKRSCPKQCHACAFLPCCGEGAGCPVRVGERRLLMLAVQRMSLVKLPF